MAVCMHACVRAVQAQEFADKMREKLPRARDTLQSNFGAPVRAHGVNAHHTPPPTCMMHVCYATCVCDVQLGKMGRAAKGAIHALLPESIEAAAVAAQKEEATLQLDDLSPADAAALQAITSAFNALLEEEEEAESPRPRAAPQAEAGNGTRAHSVARPHGGAIYSRC